MSAVLTPEQSTINTDKKKTVRVIKRDKSVTQLDPNRISTAIKKAYIAANGDSISESEHVHNRIEQMTLDVCQKISQHWQYSGLVDVEAIQDLVELALMREGEQKVAREYVIYRETRRLKREETSPSKSSPSLNIKLTNANTMPLTEAWLQNILEKAAINLKNIDTKKILDATINNLFDGVEISDVFKAIIMTSRTLIETEPEYTYLTARLLRETLFQEALPTLNIDYHYDQNNDVHQNYQAGFTQFIHLGIKEKLLNQNLLDFDLATLAEALKPERDNQFTYLGLQTLYDRYFTHLNNIRIELPQVFFMRVAMGLAHCEGNQRNERAIEFYNLLSSFDYMSSTPTLFNSGTLRPQLSSCYLTTVPDNLDGIYGAIKDNALLSKFAGGLGNDWTSVRPMGAYIKGTNGSSLGVVPFLNVADATAVAVNQGGKRKGAVCAYLETWHMDIEEFLDLRKNTGDERRRTHDMNTANWIPDLFMERVFEKKDWTLFSSDETPELHETYGEIFKQHYLNYEAKAARGEVRSKTIPATTLWRKMLSMLFETGHPWVTFKDPCNIRSPQQHCGVIHSSNLCTEITLNTSEEEIAVCNLGSINLAQHINDGKLDHDKLKKTINTAIRMLDNVIDINFYSVPQAKNSNLKHRPIGMGLMGFQDALYQLEIPYAGDTAVEFADQSMEAISYYAILASSELAKERGSYATYEGSLWQQGILPIDSIQQLKSIRGKFLEQNTEQTLNWDTVRSSVRAHGMRNSNVMAIAPTATISNICGVTQSIEPTYQNLFVKSNLSGEFTVINPYLVRNLKALNLWDSAMIHDLKFYNGSVQNIDRIPDHLKERYANAFEVEPRWLVEAASRRQKWIDQAQSLNLYMAEPSGKKLDLVYRMAWLRGLKTTYYLRSVGATNTEKSTIHDNKLNAVQQAPKACAIDDPDCEACQ